MITFTWFVFIVCAYRFFFGESPKNNLERDVLFGIFLAGCLALAVLITHYTSPG